MTQTEAPLQVLTAVAGGPSLLEAQLAAIRRFFPTQTKILVVDDSRRRSHYTNNQESGSSRRLHGVATAFDADYSRLPQYLHFRRQLLFSNPSRSMSTGPSLRTADSVQYGLSKLELLAGQLVILDSDMIPIADFRPDDYFGQSAVWFLPQARTGLTHEVVYPWPGIFMADLNRADTSIEMSWDCATVDGIALDTGGAMTSWLQANAASAHQITGLHSGKWNWSTADVQLPLSLRPFLDFDASQNDGVQFAELFEGSFLHLRAGSNWEQAKRSTFQDRMNLFTSGIKDLVAA